MQILRRVLVIMCALVTAVTLVGCEDKGPAQRAGEQVDQAAKTVGDTIKDAAEKVGETAEKAGKEIKKTTD